MELMKDTGSLTNALMENRKEQIKVGDTFAELLWSDRTLYKVVGIEGKKILAKQVSTELRNGWEDGTEYPKVDEKGEWILCDTIYEITKPRKYWKMNGHTVHLCWGATTGYRDPSF